MFCRSIVVSVSEKRSNVSDDRGRGLCVDSDKPGEKEEEEEKTCKSCKDTSRLREWSLSGPIVDTQIGTVGAWFGKCFRCFSSLPKCVRDGLWFSPLCPLVFCWKYLSLSRRVPTALLSSARSNSSSGYLPSLSRFSLQWVCLLCFILRFWNHTFTCFSVKSSNAAISTRLGLQRYLLKWNSFSSSRSWVLV